MVGKWPPFAIVGFAILNKRLLISSHPRASKIDGPMLHGTVCSYMSICQGSKDAFMPYSNTPLQRMHVYI
jgi:hypothetical protein